MSMVFRKFRKILLAIVILTGIYFSLGTINTYAVDYTPVITSVEPLKKIYDYNWDWSGPRPTTTEIDESVDYKYQPFNGNYLLKDGNIYPGSRIRVSGQNFMYSSFTEDLVKVYLNSTKISVKEPSNFVSGSFIDLNLPNDTTTGQNCIIIQRPSGEKSGEFCFEIKKNACKASDWKCENWNTCSLGGTQTRTCNKISTCEGGVASPAISQSCTYTPPVSACTANDWSCGSWGSCSINGTKARTCNKLSNCQGGISAPTTSQSCTYTPACSADTWQCGNWGSCSPQGIQTRSCKKTFDCPFTETAAPGTAQYCQSSSSPIYQSPADIEAVKNQESIIRATVQLKCPSNLGGGEGGSGTIIDSKGTILTNKHLITNEQWKIDKAGCYVGFIDSYKDVPYFGDRQIADIYKVSANEDVALLKLRNPTNKSLSSINISQGNNNSLKPTDKLVIYGYPGIGGDTITVTPGYYNGISGNYLKTDAKITHGNSGGGAYTTDGVFMGIPTGAKSDDITNLGYVLSVNTINSWINNSPITYSPSNTNNYSRVASILENMTVDQINKFQIYAPGTEPSDSSQEKALNVGIDMKLVNRLRGNILLQVESKGEAYYINPADNKRYYLGYPADALAVMKKVGLGTTHKFITGYKTYPANVVGKILLDVEDQGKAYYIYPKDRKAYYLGKPKDAFKIMRELGLGITNSNLDKIPEGSL